MAVEAGLVTSQHQPSEHFHGREDSRVRIGNWKPPMNGRATVRPVTRRMTQQAEMELYGKCNPISFDAAKAANPAQQSCLRANYGC